MALQINAPETIRIIEDLSRRTGESRETAVHLAVQERLPRLRRPEEERVASVHTPEEEADRRAEVYALVHELQGYFKEYPDAVVDHGELLYGEDGLPRTD